MKTMTMLFGFLFFTIISFAQEQNNQDTSLLAKDGTYTLTFDSDNNESSYYPQIAITAETLYKIEMVRDEFETIQLKENGIVITIYSKRELEEIAAQF